MAITHAFVLNTDARPDGTRLVMLRITSQRRRKYVDTGVYVTTEQYNPGGDPQKKNWVFKKNPNATELNNTLAAWHKRITDLIQRLLQTAPDVNHTAEQVKARLLGKQSQSLSGYIEAQIAGYTKNDQDDNARNHQSMLNVLRKFLFGYDVPRKQKGQPITAQVAPEIYLHDLTPETIRNFEAWLLAQSTTRSNSTPGSRRNYVTDRLRRLRQHITQYVAHHRLPSEADPTRGMKFSTVETDSVWLTEAELIKWEDATLPINTRGEKSVDAARIVYLASYYLHGIRAGDILSLRVNQIETVWEMHEGKTRQVTRLFYMSDKKDKTKSVIVEPYLKEMLAPFLVDKSGDQFIFPFLPARLRHLPEVKLGPEIDKRVSYVNRLLKQVSKQLETNPSVSMHSARRTFADELYEKTGDLRLVQNSLQHSNIITTQRYVTKGKQKITDKANAIYSRRSTGTSLAQGEEPKEKDAKNDSLKSA